MRKRRPARSNQSQKTPSPTAAGEIRLNDEFAGTVRDVSAKGSGVVEHPRGRVFFVPGVWIDEQGIFRVTGLKGRFGHARLERLTAPSPHRVAPGCTHHGQGPEDCGGCPWQFMDYAAQCQAKETRVRAAMDALGAGAAVKPLWPSPQVYGYRNRAQLKTDGSRLGYVAAASNRLVPVIDCPILTRPNRSTLQDLLGRLPESDWKPERGKPWTRLDIDEDVAADAVVPDQRRPFRQGNTAQNTRMQAWLATTLENSDRAAPILELFAGDGNFTGVLAGLGFSSIVALDSAPQTIAALADKQLPGVSADVCDLYAEGAYTGLKTTLKAARILLLDPPRDGVRHIDSLLSQARQLQRVLYISCDLATFTRDISQFLNSGFQLEEVQPLDQFPHTPHIELLGSLTRR